jgi:Sap, sulfolipid-1-addressing protein
VVADLILIGLGIALQPFRVSAFILITHGRPLRFRTAPAGLVLIAKLALGIALIVIAAVEWHRRDRPHTAPAWLARLDTMSPWTAAVMAAIAQPWTLVAAGAVTITQARLSDVGDWFGLASFCLLSTSSFLVQRVPACQPDERVADECVGNEDRAQPRGQVVARADHQVAAHDARDGQQHGPGAMSEPLVTGGVVGGPESPIMLRPVIGPGARRPVSWPVAPAARLYLPGSGRCGGGRCGGGRCGGGRCGGGRCGPRPFSRGSAGGCRAARARGACASTRRGTRHNARAPRPPGRRAGAASPPGSPPPLRGCGR